MGAFRPSANVQALADALRPALGMAAQPVVTVPDFAFAAHRHRVAPLLHAALASSAPSRQDERLAQFTRHNAYGILGQKMAGQRLADLFGKEGISHVEIKGWRLGELLYGEAALRQSRDVDVLVGPGQIAKAVQLASQHGYRSANGRPLNLKVAQTILRLHREVELRDPSAGIIVELHSRVLEHPPQGWSDEAFHTAPLDLTSPLYVLYLVLHGAGTQWKRLKWLADLAMIVQRVDEPVRREVLSLARQFDCVPAVAASLQACKALWQQGEADLWLGELAADDQDDRVRQHLAAFETALNMEGDQPLSLTMAKRLELVRDVPLFGDETPSRFHAMGKRAALWALRRF